MIVVINIFIWRSIGKLFLKFLKMIVVISMNLEFTYYFILCYNHFMNTKKEILTFLQEHKEELLSRFNVSTIGLFGSFSRGEQHASSDVDILVDFDEEVKDFYVVKTALREYLSTSFNRSTDLARQKYLKPYAKEQILKDVIYI